MNNVRDSLNVMIDIETLGTSKDAVILSIGAVIFKVGVTNTYEFETAIKLDFSKGVGRSIDSDTLLWWLSQDKEAIQEAFFLSRLPRVDLRDALNALYSFIIDTCGHTDNYSVWGNGADFDLAILADAYKQCGLLLPWSFRHTMCFRALKNLFPEVEEPEFLGSRHKALDDARHQVKYLQAIYAKNL